MPHVLYVLALEIRIAYNAVADSLVAVDCVLVPVVQDILAMGMFYFYK